MHAIGAGGGSIAWVDEGGALNFGPESAGADPGPVCYGRGGTRTTFTDAAVISGLIDPGYFLGGRLGLDVARARAALDEQVVRPLGLADIEDAASGIIDLAESKMAAAIESITVEKGHDPREFVLLAFGGGGPLVAGGLARRLGIPRVVVPESPGTFSARGMTVLDLVHDFARTAITPEASVGPVAASVFDELRREGDQALARERVPGDRRELQSFIDARYASQEHTITLALGANGGGTGLASDAIRARFDERHESLYSYSMPDPIEAVAFRLRAVGRRSAPIARDVRGAAVNGRPPRKGERRASHPQSGRDVTWDIYERADLAPGARVDGPAIVEEASTTTLVHAGQSATVDRFGNLVIGPAAAA
jgi:N-methylhydantoinase A